MYILEYSQFSYCIWINTWEPVHNKRLQKVSHLPILVIYGFIGFSPTDLPQSSIILWAHSLTTYTVLCLNQHVYCSPWFHGFTCIHKSNKSFAFYILLVIVASDRYNWVYLPQVRAMEMYGRIYRVVEPKKQRLELASSQLREKQNLLADAKAKLAEVISTRTLTPTFLPFTLANRSIHHSLP